MILNEMRCIGAYNPSGLYPSVLIPVFADINETYGKEILYHQIVNSNGVIERFEPIEGYSVPEFSANMQFRSGGNAPYFIQAKRCIAFAVSPSEYHIAHFSELDFKLVEQLLADFRMFRNPITAIQLLNDLFKTESLVPHLKRFIYSDQLSALYAAAYLRKMPANLDDHIEHFPGQAKFLSGQLSDVSSFLNKLQPANHELRLSHDLEFKFIRMSGFFDLKDHDAFWEAVGRSWRHADVIPIVYYSENQYFENELAIERVLDLETQVPRRPSYWEVDDVSKFKGRQPALISGVGIIGAGIAKEIDSTMSRQGETITLSNTELIDSAFLFSEQIDRLIAANSRRSHRRKKN